MWQAAFDIYRFHVWYYNMMREGSLTLRKQTYDTYLKLVELTSETNFIKPD